MGFLRRKGFDQREISGGLWICIFWNASWSDTIMSERKGETEEQRLNELFWWALSLNSRLGKTFSQSVNCQVKHTRSMKKLSVNWLALNIVFFEILESFSMNELSHQQFWALSPSIRMIMQMFTRVKSVVHFLLELSRFREASQYVSKRVFQTQFSEFNSVPIYAP